MIMQSRLTHRRSKQSSSPPCSRSTYRLHVVSRQHRLVVAANASDPDVSGTRVQSHPQARAVPFWQSYVSRRMNLDLCIDDAVTNVMGMLSSSAAAQPPPNQRPVSDPAGEPASASSPAATAAAASPPSSPGVSTPAPDIAFIFVSSAFADSYDGIVPQLRRRVPSLRYIVGCSGYGVVGMTGSGSPEEVESAPALSLTLAQLPPSTEITLTYLTPDSIPDGDASPLKWAQMLGVPAFPERPLSLVVLADPSFSKTEDLLAGLDYAFPTAGKLGGLSSAGTLNPSRTIFCWSRKDADAHRTGCVEEEPAGRQQRDAGSTAAASSETAEQEGTRETSEAAAAEAAAARSSNSSSSGVGASSQGSRSSGGSSSSASVERLQSEVLNDAAVEQDAWRAFKGGLRAQVTGVRRAGAAVLALHGGLTMDLMVAQGCRPLTPNLWQVQEMSALSGRVVSVRSVAASVDGGGKSSQGGRMSSGRLSGAIPPLAALHRELQTALGPSANEQQAKELILNLTLGVSPRDVTSPVEPQEFLIRGMAFDKEGSMVVGDDVRVGQTLRFMVRDRRGAMEDLRSHGLSFKRRELEASLMGSSRPAPFGMLLFSCNGRGNALYAEPSFDSRTLASFVPVPASGFLCNGEIGTVSGATRLHGFTCSVGVLRCLPQDDGNDSP